MKYFRFNLRGFQNDYHRIIPDPHGSLQSAGRVLIMSIFIAAAGISTALFIFRATRTLGAVGLLLVSYFFPIIDLALAGILLVGMLLNVCWFYLFGSVDLDGAGAANVGFAAVCFGVRVNGHNLNFSAPLSRKLLVFFGLGA